MFCFSTSSSGRCLLALSPPPSPTVHSNSKSNTAGRLNNREPITLAHTNMTPVHRLGPFHREVLYNLCPKLLLSRVMPIKPLHYNNFDLFKSQNYPSFLHNSPLCRSFGYFCPSHRGQNNSFSERPNKPKNSMVYRTTNKLRP